MAKKGGNKKLKRLAAPKTWKISRKEGKWIVKPRPGPHSLETSIPLGVVIRDMLKLAKTMKEVRYILRNGKVKVDGKIRKDYKFPVGFMDTISIPTINKYYRVIYDKLGRIDIVEIPQSEANKKLVRINGKRLVRGGKIQLNLHDGRNILTDNSSLKPGDTLLISLPDQSIEETVKLEPGKLAYITGGSHSGELGSVVEVIPGTMTRPALVKLKNDDTEIVTRKDYVFVVGDENPKVTIR